ncbi:hypothetical protein NHQ30_010126 [Ciborinia camelliae]|nr:hypothetical protein NHQ30_010126 [Ciborinia camelliae]
MIEPHTSQQPWDLTSVIDLHASLSTSNTPPNSNREVSFFEYCTPQNEPSTKDSSGSALGDFTPLWNYLGVDANTVRQELNVNSYESRPSSFASTGIFSGLDNLQSSATDDSDVQDIFEAYVTKSKEVRWKDPVHDTKFTKLQQQSTQDLGNHSEDGISFSEKGKQVLPPKKVDNSPFASDRPFDTQSPSLQRRQTLRQELSRISQTDESSGLESEVETPSRSKSARPFTHIPVVVNNEFERGAIHPILNLTLEEKRIKIANKLSEQLGINKDTLLSTPTTIQPSTDPETIHVFVDFSNIIIGFYEALKVARSIPETMYTKQIPPFSYRSLAFIMERNRPATRRILVGSKIFSSTDSPTHFAEAQYCGYETNILNRVWKEKESTPKKARGGRGNGYLTSQSSGSETPYINMPVTSFYEQGVDEILYMKILETLNDFQNPSTIVLASGDGAEAEYSPGFFKNVMRALSKGWKVEIVAWKKGLSHEYQSKSFQQRWKGRFRIILLDDFSEELLAIYSSGTKHETPLERLSMQSPWKTQK